MKKVLMWLFLVVLMVSFTFIGIGCKEEAVTTEVAVEETPEETTDEETVEEEMTEEEISFEGVELSIVLRSGFKYEDLMDDYAPVFKEKTGIDLNITYLTFGQMQEKFATDFVSGTGSYDVVNFPVSFEGNFYQYLANLQPFIDRDDWDLSDYYPGIIQSEGYKLSPEGDRYGIPHQAAGMVLYYRKDIFDKLNLSDPTYWTWEDFINAQKEIKESGLITYPFVTAGVNIQLVKLFLATYMPNNKALFTETGEPIYNEGQEGIKALKTLKEIFKYTPPDTLALDVMDASQVFLVGDAAMLVNWPSMVSTFLEDPDNSKVMGLWDATRTPGPGNLAADEIVMIDSSKNKEAAWEFIKWYTGEEMTKNVLKYTGVTQARMSSYDIEDLESFVPDIEGQKIANDLCYIGEFHQGAPGGGQWQAELGNNLGAYMQGEIDEQTALDNTALIWEESNADSIGNMSLDSWFVQKGVETYEEFFNK
jgi:multiple sugar transport system substrate-binding protein